MPAAKMKGALKLSAILGKGKTGNGPKGRASPVGKPKKAVGGKMKSGGKMKK